MRPGLIRAISFWSANFLRLARTRFKQCYFIPTGNRTGAMSSFFNYPLQPDMTYIKRIVGIPGDIVEYRDKVLTVNGKPASDIPDGTYSYHDDTDSSEIHKHGYVP